MSPSPADHLEIFIDGTSHRVRRGHLTGQQLRELVAPPATELWFDIPDAQDQAIATNASIEMEEGLRFFTNRQVSIYLDRVSYKVPSGSISEQQLRALPRPPVPDDREVWRDIEDEQDRVVAVNEIVIIDSGDRFFTQPMPLPPITIIVNGRKRSTRNRELSFDEVVALAFADAPQGENVIYTVTYTKALKPRPNGSLVAGGTVTAQNGTTFNVTATDKS